ncbi:33181_t:CDS:2, partial [Gigaspora margarita]
IELSDAYPKESYSTTTFFGDRIRQVSHIVPKKNTASDQNRKPNSKPVSIYSIPPCQDSTPIQKLSMCYLLSTTVPQFKHRKTQKRHIIRILQDPTNGKSKAAKTPILYGTSGKENRPPAQDAIKPPNSEPATIRNILDSDLPKQFQVPRPMEKIHERP